MKAVYSAKSQIIRDNYPEAAHEREERKVKSMEKIRLAQPELADAGEIWAYRAEMLAAGMSIDGGAALEKAASPEEWIEKVRLCEKAENCQGKVPSHVYLAKRESDGKMVGVIDLRHHIDHPVLSVWGGHIGYSVRASEQRKGYGTEMLRLLLPIAAKRGLKRVLVTCDDGNVGSEKIIRHNGGVYEKSVTVDGEVIKRFWITLDDGHMLSFYGGKAVIEPYMAHPPVENFPQTVVSVFSRQLFDALASFLEGKEIGCVHDADGVWPVCAVTYRGKRFAFYKAKVGAPACVGNFEDVIAMGAKRIILLGNCGVLDKSIEDCGIIIPTAALRDEGTSYHYAPAMDMISVNRRGRETFREILRKLGYPYVEGITWTTDAFYRETREKVEDRRARGAVCVEMECAAMQALCDFRGVEFFQFFYAGDNLDHSVWDPRSLSGEKRLDDKQKIGLLAFEQAWAMEESACL